METLTGLGLRRADQGEQALMTRLAEVDRTARCVLMASLEPSWAPVTAWT